MIPTKLNPMGISYYIEAEGNPVFLNDINPNTHIMPTKLKSDVISDFTGEKVTTSGKNLIDLSLLKESTVNGITFTPDAKDGTIRVNGTAVKQATYTFAKINKVIYDLCLSGCPKNGGYNNYTIQCVMTGLGLPTYYGDDKGEGLSLSVNNGREMRSCYIKIIKGYKAENLIFKPQLEIKKNLPPSSFMPYVKGDTYEALPDGTVMGVKSIYPEMTLSASNNVIIKTKYKGA